MNQIIEYMRKFILFLFGIILVAAQVVAANYQNDYTTVASGNYSTPGISYAPPPGPPDQPPGDATTNHTVTVNGGTSATGSNSYAAGETVNISAGTPPAGQQFKNWTTSSAGVSFANANSSSTSFVMPANDVTVTANFEAIPVVNAQTPTITSQPKNETVNVGDAVNLSVTASVTDGGVLSYQWYKESAAISGATASTYSPPTTTAGTTSYYAVITNTNYSVNGTKIATAQSSAVTVVVNAIPVKTYTVTVNGGTGATGSGSYAESETINIGAGTPPAGQRFKNWTTSSAGVSFANANSSSTSFTMPANDVTVTANFEAIPVVNAQTPTITSQPKSATVNVGDAANLSVTANVTDGGILSYQWYKGSAAISGATASTYSPSTTTAGTTSYYVVVTNTNNSVNGTKIATAQSSAVTVVVNAIPVKTYTVTVNGGTGAIGAGSYAAGETIKISAGTPPAGKQFKNWTTSSAGVSFANANSSNTSFVMPANDVTVTANFEAIPVVNAQTPTITSQPKSATVNVGNAANLSVTANVTDGGNLSYQWYKGSAAISGATASTYSPPTTTAGTTNYYVVITNTNNSVNGTKIATAQSSAVTVVVNAIPTSIGNIKTGTKIYTENSSVRIESDATIKFVEIYSLMGRLIYEIRVNTNQVRIDNLQRGIIVVKVSFQGEEPEVRKVLIK